MTTVLALILIVIPRETTSQKHPAEPEFLTHRNCEIINVCCNKLLNFEIIVIQQYIAKAGTTWEFHSKQTMGKL